MWERLRNWLVSPSLAAEFRALEKDMRAEMEDFLIEQEKRLMEPVPRLAPKLSKNEVDDFLEWLGVDREKLDRIRKPVNPVDELIGELAGVKAEVKAALKEELAGDLALKDLVEPTPEAEEQAAKRSPEWWVEFNTRLLDVEGRVAEIEEGHKWQDLKIKGLERALHGHTKERVTKVIENVLKETLEDRFVRIGEALAKDKAEQSRWEHKMRRRIQNLEKRTGVELPEKAHALDEIKGGFNTVTEALGPKVEQPLPGKALIEEARKLKQGGQYSEGRAMEAMAEDAAVEESGPPFRPAKGVWVVENKQGTILAVHPMKWRAINAYFRQWGSPEMKELTGRSPEWREAKKAQGLTVRHMSLVEPEQWERLTRE
jgi:hypothetical protein